MIRNVRILFCYFFFIVLHVSAQGTITVEGELKKWHKITLNFNGKNLTENDAYNPFLNYRLTVTFTNQNNKFVVPGFFAADGNASESSAKSGSVWQVRFRPNQTGKWHYKVSFRKGDEIAISDEELVGEPVSFDGTTGSFLVKESIKQTNKNFAKGRLQYVGSRYLQYAETKTKFLKGGADSPENFLAYYEFDNTTATHTYQPHAKDWKTGDPTWKSNKGKNIIGALNYLASKGMNSVYFLTMNVQGDGNDVWPWTSKNERLRFDCSKLDQWELIFDHMDRLGLMLHIVLQETENELLLDIGQLGVQRKVYLRELIARFGHHIGITWNIGEENGPVHWSPKGQNDADRKAMAKYIKDVDPYDNFVVLHTHSVIKEQDQVLEPLLGYEFLDGPSVQVHHPSLAHQATKKWIEASQKAKRNWVVSLDEIGPADVGAKPDADDPSHDEVRGPVLWANLMAGGSGVEWYFGYKFAHMDLNCEDWRSRDALWDQTKIALDFFQEYLPFDEMHSADELTQRNDDYVFVKNNVVYSMYFPKVEQTHLNLAGSKNEYTVQWFNPKEGGALQEGTVSKVSGGKLVDIGYPPLKEGDWVVLLQSEKNLEKPTTGISEVITLDALSDFELQKNTEEASFYRDEKNGVFAIDASNKNFRNTYATAYSIFKGTSGLYKASFVSMAENDGESDYELLVNGAAIDTIVNPEVNTAFKTINHNLGMIYMNQHDLIEIRAKAVTNGKIPENDETAWSRGRWSALKFVPESFSVTAQLHNVAPFEEKNGFLEVEAEAFHTKTNNGTKRDWVILSADEITDKNNTSCVILKASNDAYIQALPDTRVTHKDPLIHGENFFPIAGMGGIVSYKIQINTPGKYYVWANAFSTGTEDNGVHVGINEEWPESGARMQWCEGKNKWTWSSAQRLPKNHCGTANTISLNFETKGTYIISFSMREDGFKMDRWIITTDSSFIPE